MTVTFRNLFTAIGLIAAILTGPAAAERRLALVIGNGDYQHTSRLANPTNDAQAMALKFEELGFETYAGYDLDKVGMERLLRDFTRAAKTSDMNVFFYAGHGMSVAGENYLIPVDAMFEDETALDFEAVPVSFVTRQMTVANAVNLVFLDACRDNPLSRTLSRSMGSTRSAAVTSGLSEMKIANPGKGMAIAFATSPGEVALDGDSSNSPFTSALLRHIDAENTDIAEVFTRVTGDVYESTDQAQRPWLNVSLTGPVTLNPVNRVQEPVAETTSTTTTATASSGAMLEEQKLLFQLARETGDVEDYKAYLESFPTGLYANNARRMIRKIEAKEGTTTLASTRTSRTSSNDGSRASAISEVGPLVLPVTPQLRALPATKYTEQELGLDRTMRGNIQARLNATGNNVGRVDGQWGGKTRRGISNWQASNGLTPTGHLNRAQYELLMSQTEGRFTPYTAPKTSSRVSSSGKKKGRRASGNNNNSALGGVLLGVAIGTILRK